MSEWNPYFNIKSCTFTIEKEKESTSRVVLFREFGIMNTYTAETSFYGSKGNQDDREDIHFSNYDLYEIGKDMMKCAQ